MEQRISREELFQKVIEDIPIREEDHPYGITFVAGPGSGKSTIARKLSEKTGLYVTANDRVRRIMAEYDYDGIGKDFKLSQELSNERTQYMLSHKTSMIIDANMSFYYQLAIDNFNQYEADLYFIKILCSEDTAINRIAERAKRPQATDSRATVNDYYNYKDRIETMPFPEELVFYTIDSERELDPQINELVEAIKENRKEITMKNRYKN